MGNSYEKAGVNYDILDAAKREALLLARQTASYPAGQGVMLDESSFGESATVIDVAGQKLAFVLECLGTKSLIAKQYFEMSHEDRFEDIAYDAVAAIVNDLICVGAIPMVINAYFATGSSDFYENPYAFSLARGWQAACKDSGAAWGGGESPTLSGLIKEGAVEVAGSAVGKIPNGLEPLSGDRLEPGDDIVLIYSNGMHTNGASLARQIASQLPDSYLTLLDSGRTFGSAVLDKSFIYQDVVADLSTKGDILHYASHITGHGLRKIMRADRELTYRLHTLTPVPEVLQFMVQQTEMSKEEAYATLNMGAGFALYISAGRGEEAVLAAEALGHGAIVAGKVEEGKKCLIVEPISATYGAEDLLIR